MNLKKRTNKEVEESSLKGDYTGGYEMLPWFIYMRQFVVVAGLGCLIGGTYAAITSDGYNKLIGVAFVIISGVIFKIFANDYKKLKKGQSS